MTTIDREDSDLVWGYLAPEERCDVCGQPDNCGDCDHTPLPPDQVAILLAPAQVQTDAWGRPFVPYGSGWDIFEPMGANPLWHAPYEIQADSDFPEVFGDDDSEAWRHVVTRAAGGGTVELAALAFLSRWAIDEIIRMYTFLFYGSVHYAQEA